MNNRLNWFRLIVAGAVIVSVAVFGGCESPLDPDTSIEEDDGTVTLSLSNASGAPPNSWFAVFVFESGADPNTREGLVAVNYSEISDGGVSGLVLKEPVEGDWEPSEETWIATGGETYVRYVYSTTDINLDYDTTSKVTVQHPDTFSVDGDFTEEFDYVQDLVDAPTLTVEVTGAEAAEVTNAENETYFVAVVVVDGEFVSLIDVTFSGESFSILMENENEATWLYEPGTEYVVVFILSSGDIDSGPATPGSYTLWTEMTFDQSDGHSTFAKPFEVPDPPSSFNTEDLSANEQNTWYGPYVE